MKPRKPQLEVDITSDPELLRLLTAKPELYRRILAAAVVSEQIEEARDAYLSGTDEGFTVLSNFISFLEIPVSPVTGEPMKNDAGDYLWPFADPSSGEPLYWSFARWMMQHYLTSFKAMQQQQATTTKQSTPLEALPLGSGRVN